MTSSVASRTRTLLLCSVAAVFVLVLSALDVRSESRILFPRPGTHKGAWAENHGMEAQLQVNESGQSGSTCLTCHEKNDCIACHATRPPRDHTNYWRTTGHGLTASVTRERCQICHRQDYCVRCHNETAPRSHVAGWINRHCQSCHVSGSVPGGSCGVCHKRSPH